MKITAVKILRSPYDTVALVVTQGMGAWYKVTPVSKLVAQIVRDMWCQKLSILKLVPLLELAVFVNNCHVWPSTHVGLS